MNKNDKNNRGVSVVICTYNGAKRIKPTLEHIAQQAVSPEIAWEVIIVNNNSKDETAQIAQQLWNATASPVPFRIVKEEQAGLRYAKARGLAEAQLSYLIYVDDDNSISSNYVQTVYDIFEKYKDVGICSGDSFEAIPETLNLPFWWKDFKQAYAVGQQGRGGGYKENGFLWGAASAFRVEALQQVFDEIGYEFYLTGRIGNKLAAGEDAEMCFVLKRLGYKMYYTPELSFSHHIPVNRINEDYLLRLQEGFGAASVILSIYSDLELGKQPNWRSTFTRTVRSYFAKQRKLRNVKNNEQQRFRIKANMAYTKSRIQELWRYRSKYRAAYQHIQQQLPKH